MDPERTNPASGAQFVQEGYSPWAPRGLVGSSSKAGVASLACGVTALLLSAFSTLPLVAWLTALLSVAFGLGVLLPRATGSQKLASGAGIVNALVAMGLLLT